MNLGIVLVVLVYYASFLLAGLLGFAAHRASLCTVKGVAEVLSTRRAYMLASFAKTVLWVVAITWLVSWTPPYVPMALVGYESALASLAGGFLFGLGAAVNQGCAFSTLNRLGSGDAGMLATVIGFSAGLAGAFAAGGSELKTLVFPGLAVTWESWVIFLAVPLYGWAIWEAWTLWRHRPAGMGFSQLMARPRYRLSTAAVLIGLSGGVLYAMHGNWTYTSTLGLGVQSSLFGAKTIPPLANLMLFVAVMVGIWISALQRDAFRLRAPGLTGWLRHLCGGLMMGAGAALVPGGNDVLILQAIPALLPHAVLAYGALLVGCAVALVIIRRVTGEVMQLDCSGDICTQD
jgi:uncharacterized membrane protein YedE/YeeE